MELANSRCATSYYMKAEMRRLKLIPDSAFRERYPLIHVMSHENGVTVYDARTHFAFRATHAQMAIIREYLLGASKSSLINNNNNNEVLAQISAILRAIDALQSNGALLEGPFASITITDRDAIEKCVEYYDLNIVTRKFSIEVTEDCNLRCKYCPNTLATSNRVHAKTYMSFDVARKGIDYYYARYASQFLRLDTSGQEKMLALAPPQLSWYGGEPLLNFDLIRDSHKYFVSLPWSEIGIPVERLAFAINTNFTIATQDILEFLVKNRVITHISLDGPREQHDKNRIFEDGRGSFDTVYRNLRNLYEYSPSFFRTSVYIFSVGADNLDYDACKQFFSGHAQNDSVHMEAYDRMRLPVTYRGQFVKDVKENLDELTERTDSHIEELFNRYRASLLSTDCYKGRVNEIDSLFPFLSVDKHQPQGLIPYSSVFTCPMAFDNLMVGTNGILHMCHKTDGSFPVGDVTTGPDTKKIADYYVAYNSTMDNITCKSCWKIRFCRLCAAVKGSSGTFIMPDSMECEYLRANSNVSFSVYSSLIEEPATRQRLHELASNTVQVGIIDIQKLRLNGKSIGIKLTQECSFLPIVTDDFEASCQ